METLAAVAIAMGPSDALKLHVVEMYQALESCKFDKVRPVREATQDAVLIMMDLEDLLLSGGGP